MSYYQALGLSREPFSNAPDPDLLYRARTHLECLQHMEIAVRLRRGLNVVFGDVGTGKTTLARELCRLLGEGGDIEVRFLDDPYQPTGLDFLRALARLFGLHAPDDDPGLLREALKAALRAGGKDGRIVALIVDEGQKITGESLELLRELLNVETSAHKLLQIVVFAQTEFEDMLAARPNLDDRVNFRYRLAPLDRRQTRRMIETRLALCTPDGGTPPLFTPLALRRIHRLTGGYPRKIVRLCHLSMLLAVGFGRSRIGWGLVGRAARQSRGLAGAWLRPAAVAGTLGAAALAGLLVSGPGLPGARQAVLAALHRATDVLEKGAAAPPATEAPAATIPREPADTARAWDTATAAGTSPIAMALPSRTEAGPETAAPAAAGLQESDAPATVAQAPAQEADPAGPAVAAWTLRAETAPRPAAASPAESVPASPKSVAEAPWADAPEQVIVVGGEETGPVPAPRDTLGAGVVRPGWTVSRLAARVYGNGGRQVLDRLAEANPGVPFDRVRAGETLVYPAIAARPLPAGAHLVKVAEAATLEQGLAVVGRLKERQGLTLSLYCTGHPDRGLRFDVVMPDLFPDRAAAGAALAALPAEVGGRASLVSGYPDGTTYYTDLGDRAAKRPVGRPAPVRQVAERQAAQAPATDPVVHP